MAVLCLHPWLLLLATSLYLLLGQLQGLVLLGQVLLPPPWQAALLQPAGGRVEPHGQPPRQRLELRLLLRQEAGRGDLLPLLWACFLCC